MKLSTVESQLVEPSVRAGRDLRAQWTLHRECRLLSLSICISAGGVSSAETEISSE